MHFSTHKNIRKRRFTLIEMMIAMFLSSIMAYLLIRCLMVAQQAWDMSDSISRIYENSRVAFDLIEYDVHSMATSSVEDAEIGVYVGDDDFSNANNCIRFCMVSSTDPSGDANSRLCEISYKQHADLNATNPNPKPYVLARQLISQDDSDNWNFIGMPANWYQNNNNPNAHPNSAFKTVIRGVSSFQVRFYDFNEVQIPSGTDTFIRPNKVVFDMILFDEKLTDADMAKKHRTMRAFTKVIYLNHVIQ